MSRKDKNTNQDIVSNKLLVLITVSFVSALALMWIYRGYNTLGSVARTGQIVLVLLFGAALFLIFCCIWMIRSQKKGTDESQKVFTSSNCTLGAFFGLVSLWGIYHFGIAVIRVLYVLIPLYVGLYFISRIYSKTACWTAYMCAGFGFAFYIFNKLFDNQAFSPFITPALVVTLIAALIPLSFFRSLQSGDGALTDKSGKKTMRILPERTFYWFLLIVPLLVVLACLAYFVLGTPAMRYGLFAMSGVLLISLVYHTFELMSQ